MTLVIGRKFDDLTYLIADTGSYVPLTKETLPAFTAPLAKILVRKCAAIAYSGNTFYLPDVNLILDGAEDCDAIIGSLTQLNRTSGNEIDFLVVNLDTRNISRICNGEAETVDTAHIGSHEAFSQLQHERHRAIAMDSTHIAMIKLPEVATESAQNYATDLRAFHLVLETGSADARGFAVPYLVESNEHRFGTYVFANRGPLEINELRENEPVTVNWQGAPEGAFSINFGGAERSFGCYLREGLVCIEWDANFDSEPKVSKDLEWRFSRAVREKYGIEMIGRHGHPIDPIINALIVARKGQYAKALVDIDFAIECILLEASDENGRKVKLTNNSLYDTFQHITELRIPIALVGYLEHCLEIRRTFLSKFSPGPDAEKASRDADLIKCVLKGQFAIAKLARKAD